MTQQDPEKLLLIAYHSQSGNTRSLAEAVEHGARRVEGVSVRRVLAADTTARDIIDCHCLVICSPEYFGYMAGAIKDMFDRTYERAREHTTGKSYAVVISAGNDGTGALSSIERILLGYNVRRVQDPIISRGAVTTEVLEMCNNLGHTLAAGLELGIY